MSHSRSDSLTRQALRGGLAGLILGGVIVFIGWGTNGRGAPTLWQAPLVMLAAIAVCVAGQVAARGIIGAATGALLGFIFGGALAGEPPEPPEARAQAGEQAVLRGPTLDGKVFDVAAQKGKVVLVDFWATWCPPCRVELPHVKHLRELYHDRGLRVVGVSLDSSQDELARFVANERLDWPHIFFSDEKDQGWDSPIVGQYGVKGIPHTLVIDREGRIVATGLRGQQLERTIEQLVTGAEPAGATGGGTLRYVLSALGLLAGCVIGILVERSLRRPAESP